MKRVRVEIPFHMIATNTTHVPGDIIEVSEEQLAKIRAISINMVSVLGNVEEEPEQEEPTQDETEQEEPEQEEPEKPQKRKPKAK